MQYKFDRKRGRLFSNEIPWIRTTPGSGPRHMVFHPNNRFAYVINELNSSITVYTYDPALGLLEANQTLSTVPDGYSGSNIAADLHLSPDGRFLYGSNRGHDSIVTYAVDRTTGRLTKLDSTPTQGKKPRGFALDPSGTFLLAANQDSHNIVTYWIDKAQGALIPTGHKIDLPDPVCMKFIAVGFY
jgi:6-phosphogluconolactonase